MRVITGLYKGRLLKAPKLGGVRPTQDRIKESAFEVLNPYMADIDVLELFAGSGSLGIEALSRGAKSVTFVEREPLCVKAIGENLDNLGIYCPSAVIIKSDVFKAIKHFNNQGAKFGIIIADPHIYETQKYLFDFMWEKADTIQAANRSSEASTDLSNAA